MAALVLQALISQPTSDAQCNADPWVATQSGTDSGADRAGLEPETDPNGMGTAARLGNVQFPTR